MNRLVMLSSENISAIGACMQCVIDNPSLFKVIPVEHRETVKTTFALITQLRAEEEVLFEEAQHGMAQGVERLPVV